jgi:pilus assembly protein CpaB
MRYGGLIIAIIVAAIAAFAVLKMAGNEQPAPTPEQPQAQQSKTVNVYIAAKPITIGATITEDMVGVQPWPEHLTVDGFVIADGKNNVVGMVARGQYQQNEPLMNAKLANPSDPNFLAGELPAGMRVVTIPINEVDGIAGFVFPGDHVDLIFTHDVDKWVTPPSQKHLNASGGASETSIPEKVKVTVTETLLTNVKVLAVDQRATGAGSTDKNGNLVIPRSASLMVSQSDAQRVRLAQKTGTVSMVLRALADREASDPLVLTAPKDISQSKQQDEEALGTTDDSSVKIVRGAPKIEKETESTGTQTSRGSSTTSGMEGGVLPPSMPSGRSIINPGLVAIP